MGGAALRRAAVAAHGVAVVDHRVHGDEAGEGDAQRADDLLAHGLGDCFDAAAGFQLEQRGLDAVGHGAGADCHLAGDFLGGEALGHPKQCFKLARSQRLAELANP
ncbi:hypothetical protein D3C76_790420 [compost metagenome]